MTYQPHILVIGAGIIGASITWHLARAGARVTVLEAGELGGTATRASFAWINASWGNPEPYFRLRMLAIDEWRRLETDVPGLQVAWTGGLLWDLPPRQLEAFVAEHQSWGYPIRLVDRTDAQRIEPQLTAVPELAAYAEAEGAVEPRDATQALLRAAKALGAVVVADRPVRLLHVDDGRVAAVDTESNRIDADTVVLAAGCNAASLAGSLGVVVPVRASPNLLLYSKPTRKLLNGVVLAREMHLRQTSEGRIVAAASLSGDPADASEELFDAMKRMIRAGGWITPDNHVVGYRPIPADGVPVLGRAVGLPGLYVAVTHSGITLAPAIGRLVAEELLTGERHTLLRPYGLERFAQAPEQRD